MYASDEYQELAKTEIKQLDKLMAKSWRRGAFSSPFKNIQSSNKIRDSFLADGFKYRISKWILFYFLYQMDKTKEIMLEAVHFLYAEVD